MRRRARSEQYRARAASRYSYRAQLIIESKLQHVPVRASGSHRQISSSGLWFRSLHGGPRQSTPPFPNTSSWLLPFLSAQQHLSTSPTTLLPSTPPHITDVLGTSSRSLHHANCFRIPLPLPRTSDDTRCSAIGQRTSTTVPRLAVRVQCRPPYHWSLRPISAPNNPPNYQCSPYCMRIP
jgi:hypothetical protein